MSSKTTEINEWQKKHFNLNFVHYRKVYTDHLGNDFYRILILRPFSNDLFYLRSRNEEEVKRIVEETNIKTIEQFQDYSQFNFNHKLSLRELELHAKKRFKKSKQFFNKALSNNAIRKFESTTNVLIIPLVDYLNSPIAI